MPSMEFVQKLGLFEAADREMKAQDELVTNAATELYKTFSLDKKSWNSAKSRLNEGNVNARDEKTDTAVIAVCKLRAKTEEEQEVKCSQLKYLLTLEADPNKFNNEGSTPLLVMAEQGDWTALTYPLIRCTNECINWKNAKGNTVLNLLVRADAEENLLFDLVKKFVDECHADPKIHDGNGHNAYFASKHRKDFHPKISEYLLEKMGRPDYADIAVGQIERQNSAQDQTAVQLSRLAYEGDFEELKKLVNEKNVNLRETMHCKTPLLSAAESHCDIKVKIEMINHLIQKGADLNARDNHGKSPLFYAVQLEQLEMVEILRNAGCQLEATDDNGATPLMEILKHSSHEKHEVKRAIMIYLLERCSGMATQRTDNGEEPFFISRDIAMPDAKDIVIAFSSPSQQKYYKTFGEENYAKLRLMRLENEEEVIERARNSRKPQAARAARAASPSTSASAGGASTGSATAPSTTAGSGKKKQPSNSAPSGSGATQNPTTNPVRRNSGGRKK